MAYRDPDRLPRWWVTVSAILAFGVGARVMLMEAARTTERPTLLLLAYMLMAGAPVAWAIERFRK